MRLLIDAHVFDGAHQGTRTYLKGLYGEVVKLMPGVSFYFAANNVENIRLEFGDQPNVYFVQLKRGKLLRLLVEFPYIIWKNRIDYAHFQYISPIIKSCKYIVTTHDILFKDFKHLFPIKYRLLNDFIFRISAKRADVLLTVSKYSQLRISAHYKIPVEKIGITPNGVSREFLRNDLSDGEDDIKIKYNLQRFILYVSRIEPRKNHLLLLRAFSDLKLWQSNYQLVFIGKKDFSYSDLDEFLDSCSNECRRNVLLFQNIDNTELISFYKKAELFIYPSLAEGFGIPPIEAIAVGTSILCSNKTAMSDFIFLGEDLFDPNDVQELKTKILHKLLHPNHADRTIKLRQEVSLQYSWEHAAKSFISFLKK